MQPHDSPLRQRNRYLHLETIQTLLSLEWVASSHESAANTLYRKSYDVMAVGSAVSQFKNHLYHLPAVVLRNNNNNNNKNKTKHCMPQFSHQCNGSDDAKNGKS